MKVSTKGRYALRIMLDLALNDTGDFIPLKDISRRQGITVKYLEQIITLLNKAGYLRSLRGSSGGYRLARAPKDYNVGDILRTTEGSLSPLACLDPGAPACDRLLSCPTQQFWKGLDDAINRYVDSYTLADIMEQELKGTAF